jgi:hypothetical protein
MPMPSRRSRVDLTYEDETLLSGVLAGEQVELSIDVPVSNGSAEGTYAGAPISGTWHIASNYNGSEQPASLEATFLGHEVALNTTVMLRSPANPTLVGATIVGHIGEDELEVQISRVGDSFRETFAADGTVGPVSIAIVANIRRENATIEGAIGDRR